MKKGAVKMKNSGKERHIYLFIITIALILLGGVLILSSLSLTGFSIFDSPGKLISFITGGEVDKAVESDIESGDLFEGEIDNSVLNESEEDIRDALTEERESSITGQAVSGSETGITGSVVGDGTTYYVSITGNDANPGTAASPFKTIQKCANVVKAGETCVVYEGLYPERIKFSLGHSGELGKIVTFRAEPRRSAVMYGFDTTGVNYFRIDGFYITTLPITDLAAVVGVGSTGIRVLSDNVEIVDNYFFEVAGSAIAGEGRVADNVYVARNKVYHSNRGIIASGTNWLIEDNEVERLYYYGVDADYSRFFGENITFRKNFFHGTLRIEKSDSHTDGFQTFDVTGIGGARNVIIEENIVESFSQGVMMRDTVGESSIQNITIRNNIFMGGDIEGSWVISTELVSNIQVFNNLFLNIKGNGAGVRRNSIGAIYNNIFYNVSNGLGSCLPGYDLDISRGYNILYT